MLAKFGYAAELTGLYDDKTRDIVTAFQRRFRPEICDGRLDAETARRLSEVRAAYDHARS